MRWVSGRTDSCERVVPLAALLSDALLYSIGTSAIIETLAPTPFAAASVALVAIFVLSSIEQLARQRAMENARKQPLALSPRSVVA